jgi:hypothetical protein
VNVTRGGSPYKSYPCSDGLDSVTDRNTPNGTKSDVMDWLYDWKTWLSFSAVK